MGPAWEDPRVVAGTRELLTRRERALAGGETHLGWKLAFGAPASLESLGLAGPVLGYMTDATVVEPGATVAIDAWTRPVLEAEIGIHLGRDVPAGIDPAEAAAAIASLGPAIELADADLPPEQLAEVIGAGIYHRGVVSAAAAARREGSVADDLEVTVRRDQEACAQVPDPQALVGAPAALVTYVADYLAAFGESLLAGDLLISGSTVGLIDLAPGDRLEYTLDPIGSLAIACA
jgi:2-keto-4-pentenoate hydratase